MRNVQCAAKPPEITFDVGINITNISKNNKKFPYSKTYPHVTFRPIPGDRWQPAFTLDAPAAFTYHVRPIVSQF